MFPQVQPSRHSEASAAVVQRARLLFKLVGNLTTNSQPLSGATEKGWCLKLCEGIQKWSGDSKSWKCQECGMLVVESYRQWAEPAKGVATWSITIKTLGAGLPKLYILLHPSLQSGHGNTRLNVCPAGFQSCFSPILFYPPSLLFGMGMFTVSSCTLWFM